MLFGEEYNFWALGLIKCQIPTQNKNVNLALEMNGVQLVALTPVESQKLSAHEGEEEEG